MKFELLDAVTLMVDWPGGEPSPGDLAFDNYREPRIGDVGTIVMVYDNPCEAYEVEFCDHEGRTTAMMALLPDQISLYMSVRDMGRK